MYVCICNAIRECELRKLARNCRGDAEALYIGLGRPPQCGQCIEDAEEIVEEERMSVGTFSPVPAHVPQAHPAMEASYQFVGS